MNFAGLEEKSVPEQQKSLDRVRAPYQPAAERPDSIQAS